MSSEQTHNEIMRSLGTLEAEVKGINCRLDKLNSKVASHEAELGKIDLVMAKAGGIILTISALIGLIWSVVGEWLKAKFFI